MFSTANVLHYTVDTVSCKSFVMPCNKASTNWDVLLIVSTLPYMAKLSRLESKMVFTGKLLQLHVCTDIAN